MIDMTDFMNMIDLKRNYGNKIWWLSVLRRVKSWTIDT